MSTTKARINYNILACSYIVENKNMPRLWLYCSKHCVSAYKGILSPRAFLSYQHYPSKNVGESDDQVYVL